MNNGNNIGIEGRLLMLDEMTPHVAVPVQLMRDGKVTVTVLSNEIGRYQFADLNTDDYKLRCQVPNGYVYYQNDKQNTLHVDQGKTLRHINFRFAPIKKGTWKSLTYLDGLSHNFIHAICCAPDDSMWFGSWRGVSHYDGKDFINYSDEDGLPSDDVSSIYCDHEGVLWIGTGDWFREGKGVSIYNGKKFTTLSMENGLANDTVFTIARDSDGAMWFGTAGGISRYDGKFANFTAQDGLPSNNISAIYCDLKGLLWIGTGGWSREGNGVSFYDGKGFSTITTEDGLIDNNIYSIHQDQEGIMWFGTANGVSRYDGKRFINLTMKDGLINNEVRAIYSDKDGIIWFGTLGGVSRYDGKCFVNFTEADGLVSNRVSSINKDMNGAMWFGTWGSGVSQYNSTDIINMDTKDGLASDHVSFVYHEPNGTSWIGGRGISRIDKNNFVDFAMKGELSKRVRGIHHAPDGKLWFAMEGGNIYYFDGKEFVDFASEIGINNINFCAIHGNSEGIIWFGTSGDGVYRYDGKELANLTTKDGLAHDQVWSIYCDNGLTWFGTWGEGISIYDGKTFTNLTTKDGLVSNNIFSIYKDPYGAMWFGTLHYGVSCYKDGKFTNFTAKEGLANDTVRSIYCDPDGIMYFGTQGGGVSCYDGTTWTSLDTRDGLPDNTIFSIHNTFDGRLLFATGEGVAFYKQNNAPPKAKIISITTDQIYREISEIPTLNSGTRITIDYGSIDFKTFPGKRQYRWRINEIDKKWQKPTKATFLDYTFDEPGEYTVEIQAIDRDLNYSEPAGVKLTIQPNPELAYLQAQLNHLRRKVVEKYHFESIIGQSIVIRQMRALMEKAIDSGLTVLITGETGTGKELVAKAIHYNSPRKNKPLLDINCGAVPRELVASTLFGHRKGSFTGAGEDKIGLFEAASGGTVLLDEIGEMPEEAQMHLLRVLQERKIHRIGETRLRDIDIRVIAITNSDLENEVKGGNFREDLYYRLSVFPIHVPALRERIEDIPLLAEHFLQKACKEQGKSLCGFATGVIDMLMGYPWHGNVREMEHEIYRAAVLAEAGKEIQIYHFSSRITNVESLIQGILSERMGLSTAVESLQKRMVENALKECAGNRTKAAEILGILQPNLSRLIKRLGIE